MKQFSPRAELDKAPILARLRDVLPRRGLVLELASGSGQHLAHFAQALPALRWQPSERSAPALGSIATWAAGLANVAPPIELDVGSVPWPIDAADAVIAIDLIHIVGLTALGALLAEAARVLPPGGPLCLYGAIRMDAAAPPSRPPSAALAAWTVPFAPPALEALRALGEAHGLALVEDHAMPDPERRLLVFRNAGARPRLGP